MTEKTCPKCKTTLSEFYSTGMFGCPFCYKAFESELPRVLKKVQGAERHVGKSPKVSGVDRQLVSEYERLKKEKEIAGIEGRFSDMAEITAEIFDLKAELEERGLL